MNTENWKMVLDIITSIAAIATALSAIATFITVFIARKQLQAAIEQKEVSIEQTKITIQQSRTQFEDSLAKEYRELTQKISIKALLGEKLTTEEFEKDRQSLFHYINLTNDQIFLWSKGRISLETWIDWMSGIKSNMNLPAFEKMWKEIEISENKKDSSQKSFQELRRLRKEEYKTDPNIWNN
jgi:hypothetical protein